jgi:hypothetical protein
MDKVERAKIIAVKLEEVLHDDAMEEAFHLLLEDDNERMMKFLKL